jgi:tetratricopeptide (TPR) repeat protein
MKPLRALSVALLAAGFVSFASAQTQVRSEVGKPLQQAAELLKAGKSREALAKVREADAVAGKTPVEQTMIERMRAAAAQRAGDTAGAIQALEAVFPKTSGAEQAQVAESLAFAYSQARNFPKATEWVNKAQQLGSNSAQLKQLQAWLQAQSGDYGAVMHQAQGAVSAAEAAGKRPEEDDLLRLADAAQRTSNQAVYSSTLEKLVRYYGKKDYWNAYLARLQREPGFADRLSLDVMRLKLQDGLLTKPDEYMEMAQLSLQAGLPAEGQRVVERGFASGVLGIGAEGERHKRLRDLANRQAAESAQTIGANATEAAQARDGNALVQIGFQYVTMGQADKGVALIEQGIEKGGLKRPEDARLRLGLALLQAGKKARGVQVLRSVQGTDGTAAIARLWATMNGNQG